MPMYLFIQGEGIGICSIQTIAFNWPLSAISNSHLVAILVAYTV